MLKMLQAMLQQYVNREFPDVQAGFRKGRGTRHQIANIRWIIEKAREFQKNKYSHVSVLYYISRTQDHFSFFYSMRQHSDVFFQNNIYS